MGSQPESVVVDAIRRHLGGPEPHLGMGWAGLRCICVKMHGSEYSREGFPDLVVIRPDGVTVFLEVKQPGRTDGPLRNGVSAMQFKWGRRLMEKGAIWGFASDPQEAENVVFER